MACLERRILRYLSNKNPDQYGWLYSAVRASPGIFWKLGWFSPLATHRRRTSRTLIHLARIVAMQTYDCGTCLQIAIDYARKDGVSAETIRGAVTAGGELTPEERLASAFAGAAARDGLELPELTAAVRETLGEAVLIELSLAVATAAVFPLFKRGLGVAASCRLDELRYSPGDV